VLGFQLDQVHRTVVAVNVEDPHTGRDAGSNADVVSGISHEPALDQGRIAGAVLEAAAKCRELGSR